MLRRRHPFSPVHVARIGSCLQGACKADLHSVPLLRDDILCMAVLHEEHGRCLLATGDYAGDAAHTHPAGLTTRVLCHITRSSSAGRITIWNLQSGERRAALQHDAPEFEAAVEQLAWLAATANTLTLLMSAGGVSRPCAVAYIMLCCWPPLAQLCDSACPCR